MNRREWLIAALAATLGAGASRVVPGVEAAPETRINRVTLHVADLGPDVGGRALAWEVCGQAELAQAGDAGEADPIAQGCVEGVAPKAAQDAWQAAGAVWRTAKGVR